MYPKLSQRLLDISPALLVLPSFNLLSLWINSYLVTPNAYYFLGEDGS